MKTHLYIFEEFKKLLRKAFPSNVMEHESGMQISVSDSKIWIGANDNELTLGLGTNYRNYNFEYEDIYEAIDDFVCLLTRKRRITEYFKGNYMYKLKAEIGNSKGEFKELSTSLIWLYPYWKRTKKTVYIESELLKYSEIEEEIREIRNYAQQSI